MAVDNSDNNYNRGYKGGQRGKNFRDIHKNRKNQQQKSAQEDTFRQREPVFTPHKLDTPICPRCNEPIIDLPTALAEKTTGEPVHFDCVLKYLNETEHLKDHEKIVYIGQGRFAVAFFENPHDLRRFSIVKIIEWEERDKKYEWRNTISGLYSQVK